MHRTKLVSHCEIRPHIKQGRPDPVKTIHLFFLVVPGVAIEVPASFALRSVLLFRCRTLSSYVGLQYPFRMIGEFELPPR